MQLAEQRDSRRIQLEGVVGTHEFHTVLERVAASSDPVLDFSGATHIDFRAARVFARQFRCARRRARVVGLDAYCSQILRFAWTADDWERLREQHADGGIAVPESVPISDSLARNADEVTVDSTSDEAVESTSCGAIGAIDVFESTVEEILMFAAASSDTTTESLDLWNVAATRTDGDWETVWSRS